MPDKKTKSSQNLSLGRAIINARQNIPTAAKSKKASGTKAGVGGVLPTKSATSNKNVHSVVDENSVDEFLVKAELANVAFDAEKSNVKIVSADDNKLVGVKKPEELISIQEAQNRFRDKLRIPRRPVWNESTTPEELEAMENRSFLEWRRDLAALESEEHIVLTPFERNLEIWRQLWRVVERSDVVVQIVDARNPLLFRCSDLEAYVKETDEKKVNMILINKADLLTPKMRSAWADYFRHQNIPVAFWSAANLDDDDAEKNAKKEEDEEVEDEEKEDSATSSEDENSESSEKIEESEEESSDEEDSSSDEEESFSYGGRILTRDQLMAMFKSLRLDKSLETLTVGMVGYPNVGKSSTINKLLAEKKVAVSATPGKTKHFQTLYVDEDEELCLCDCPGLVMPSFAMSKEQMIISGILPCDEMRGYLAPIGLICSQMKRAVFEKIYGVMLPKPSEFESKDRGPTPHELLTAYAFVRGFMSTKGVPDGSRAARVIVKDYVCGKLCYCHAPPDTDQKLFDQWRMEEKTKKKEPTQRKELLSILEKRHLLDGNHQTELDRAFFRPTVSGAHLKTSKTKMQKSDGKRHFNKNKKQKLRRVYGHLDA